MKIYFLKHYAHKWFFQVFFQKVIWTFQFWTFIFVHFSKVESLLGSKKWKVFGNFDFPFHRFIYLGLLNHKWFEKLKYYNNYSTSIYLYFIIPFLYNKEMRGVTGFCFLIVFIYFYNNQSWLWENLNKINNKNKTILWIKASIRNIFGL